MAHKGKLYKLWFRRDAAWDVDNYRRGWPEAYRYDSSVPITSNTYQVEALGTTNAINLSKEYDRTWQSEPVGGFLDNAYWRLQFYEPPNDVIRHFRFGIWHSATIDSPLLVAEFQLRHNPGVYELWEGGHWTDILFLSPHITVDFDRLALTFYAARWNLYNPP